MINKKNIHSPNLDAFGAARRRLGVHAHNLLALAARDEQAPLGVHGQRHRAVHARVALVLRDGDRCRCRWSGWMRGKTRVHK